MKKVGMIKGLSYRGNGIFVRKGDRLEVDDSKADILVATGYFEIQGDATDVTDDSEYDVTDNEDVNSADDDSKPDVSTKPVSKMNGAELRAYAEAKDYDISECTKVEEIRALIEELDAQ